MTAAAAAKPALPSGDSPAAKPVPPPADSLEVRWLVPGPLPAAMTDWFARFQATTETRHDTYLLQPQLPGLSVKLRDDSALEVKAYLGSPGILDLPGRNRGQLESWSKWSFPYRSCVVDDRAPAGWVAIGKRRCSSWFPLAGGKGGCTVELTETSAYGRAWWSVGFEATGPAGLLREALEGAAEVVFAQPPPARLDLASSRSYARWLNQFGPEDLITPKGPGGVPA